MGALFVALTSYGQYTLQILHASDLEGGVEAIDRAPNFAAIIDTLEDEYANTVILSAGDNYIPGPFFSAANDGSVRQVLRDVYDVYYGGITANNLRQDNGRVDITIMNLIGFDASAVGNHEFDAGSNAFETIIGEQFNSSGTEVRWIGSQFPYLSANLDFSADGDLFGLFVDTIVENTFFQANPNTLMSGEKRSIAPSTLITRGGEKIGVIGATTQILASITSSGETTVIGPDANDMDALAGILQPRINDLTAAGANKIILVSHLQQIALEESLATKLSGVDVIIAGGSDAILANLDDRLAAADAADIYAGYPIVSSNLDGDPVAIVSTNGEYSYVGRLVVDFDASGVVLPASLGTMVDGPYIADSMMVADLWGASDAFAANTKGELVQRLTDTVRQVVIDKDANVFGSSTVYLEGTRAAVRSQETNFGNLSADANLWTARQFDPSVAVSLKNGGGIRAAIGDVVAINDSTTLFLPPQANPLSGKMEGEISQLDIENTLRFNNGLSVITLSAQDLVEVIEHGISEWAVDATPGAFPQIAGAKVAFDPGKPAGSRIRSLSLTDENGVAYDAIVYNNGIIKDPEREIKIVTLDFLAGGGDGYPYPTLGEDRTDLEDILAAGGAATFADAGSEQDALAEYLSTFFAGGTPFSAAETPQSLDERIQIRNFRSDDVYTGEPCVPNLLQGPQNLTATSMPSGDVVLNWDAVPNTIACQVFVGEAGTSTPNNTVVSGTTPSSFTVPASRLDAGNDYEFAVRCACDLDPLAISPLSDMGMFSTPLAKIGLTAGYGVFPNPVTEGSINVQYTADAKTVEVVDLLGRVRFAAAATNGGLTINTAEYGIEAGMYIVHIATESKPVTTTLVVE